jgi:hypothetical protein
VLDGWTKVGDQIGATGRWTLYRHRGLKFAALEVLERWPPEEPERALKLYTKKSADIRRGGLWLVSPEGRVCSVTFIRP